MHTNNVVSDNLPIYFIWFGSDAPPKYFGNLQRAAETNKSRDIILVYSEKHLPQDNRKNIDSLESISIDDIKTRVELKRDTSTQNLFKIDVYEKKMKMELDKQDERIYPLLKWRFSSAACNKEGEEMKSFRFWTTSDFMRLPLINITGGIYFDMDTEITGEIGDIKIKRGFNYNYRFEKGYINNFNNFFAKSNENNEFFNKIMLEYIIEIYSQSVKQENIGCPSPSEVIFDYTLKNCGGSEKCFGENDGSHRLLNELSNFAVNLPITVKLNNERNYSNRTADYNNPEDLKELGLDKQGYDVSNELENLSLELLKTNRQCTLF
ncbi:glycosyltransferase [Candidatus Mesenet endosymbiont of Phosphuga atrata]|uniref:glycosyltransferase n=1 Tax=Candidatus Mesenet endosymbiont of Phosphuga atrata TaxID=3066221 RepID=UPI0030D505EC